jgi:DNA-binding NtrC family response regulator
MLILDRYLVANGRALDLATGAAIRCRHRPPSAQSMPLFTVRGRSWLIDFEVRKSSRIEVWERAGVPVSGGAHECIRSMRLALADARDGQPRALDLVEPSAEQWVWLHRVLAREARLAGFVPMAADALGAVLSQARWRWPTWLKERSLVVFATDSRVSPDASLAMFRLATRDARPHLIVRCSTSDLWRPRLVSAALHVHESAPADAPESSLSLVERAGTLRAAGQVVDAEAAARWSLLLADQNDPTPARCALAHALIDQRRLLEARATLEAIDSGERDAIRARIDSVAADTRNEPAMVDAFLDVLRTCQEIDEPDRALLRVAAKLRMSLAAGCVAIVIADRDRPQTVAHAGTAAPSAADLRLALHTLDTGLASPPAVAGSCAEVAWPVRYGAVIVGAVWCQWTGAVPLMPGDVTTLLGLAATAIGPALHQVREHLRTPTLTAAVVPDLVGQSAAMEQVRQAVIKAASSPFPVLIEGESGAGKELVARAVHSASIRRTRRFCALNCAAIADDLVETELFGHTRGAFTGAVAERVGLFEESQGGTLFLDEVAELSARVQAKLLRTLQEGEVRRLGESVTRKVDARIVAATNRPLSGEVAAGRFRNDLRYRLDVLRIVIPPLRERLEDLPPLVRHIWAELAKRTGSRAVLSPSALAMLGSYDWPGNVRELQNVLASMMVAGPGRGVIGPHGVPGHISRSTAMTGRATLAEARRQFEERYVRAALARSGGRAAPAARDLGLSRQGLRKLTTRLGLSGLAVLEGPP